MPHSTPCLAGAAALVLAGATMGCGARRDLPMTAYALSHDPSGEELVAYLTQPDASSAVCDPLSRGPHVGRLDEDGREALIDGLVSGQVQPDLWRRCVALILSNGDAEDVTALLEDTGQAYRHVLTGSEVEEQSDVRARLAAMHAIYLERDASIVHPASLDAAFDDLRDAINHGRLGPVAARFAVELIEAVDLEAGRWRGQLVDPTLVDSVSRAADERSLRLFSMRLPSPELRVASRRGVVRIHVAASPFPEVKANADAVEARVLATGSNAISLGEHPFLRAYLNPAMLLQRDVVVRQNVWNQSATLLGSTPATRVSVLPELNLRNALFVAYQGVSREITLCAPASELDPTPCIDAADVRIDSPVVYADSGVFHFIDELGIADAVSLALPHDGLEMPIRVGDQPLLTLSWKLEFERPADMAFIGDSSGANGPDLLVTADHTRPARIVFTIRPGNGSYVVAVEARDVAGFHVTSQGADGATGWGGTSGASGASGGTCENGGDGGPGSDGGAGGPGGDGGRIVLQVVCGDGVCRDDVSLLQGTISSRAGAGGSGGPGGAGGLGGVGGSAGPTTTSDDGNGFVTTTFGCSAGTSGATGSSGATGPSGPDGRPGRVEILVQR